MELLLCNWLLAMSTVLTVAAKMDTVYEWKYVDYVWESNAQKQQAIDSGEYNYTQITPYDVEISLDGRVFVTMAKRVGVPAVLGTVTNKKGPSGPLIKPYPNWSYFKQGSCDSIRNALRITIDKCERLWVLDTGSVDSESLVCDPQLLAFDLLTNRLIRRVKISKHISVGKNNASFLTAPIVETYGRRCRDTTVYMADAFGNGLVIWNNEVLSRLEIPVFSSSIGIVTMDISPKLFPNEERYLYFHSSSSFGVYGASTNALKRSIDGNDIKFVGTEYLLSSQAVAVAFSDYGNLFMGLTKESEIVCWNKYRAMIPSNVVTVARDSQRLQYINGMKVKPTYDWLDEELWVVSDRLTAFSSGKMNFNDTNFRILKGSVSKLVAGTQCDLPHEIKVALENNDDGWSTSSNEYWELNGEELRFNK